jgi:GGDEF domain-containing protein
MFDFRRVKFEHDGVYDTLTGADSQSKFAQNLARAISARKRNGGALYIFTLKIKAPDRELKTGSYAQTQQILKYEGELIKACTILHKNLRENDFFTRMAVNGFYIVISGERSEEDQFTERFKKLFADRSVYELRKFILTGNLKMLEWLAEIDRIYFKEDL